MTEDTVNLALAVVWVVIQGAILYYFIPPFRVTRATCRDLAAGDHADYAYRVAVDRHRGQIYRLTAIFAYTAVGLVVALQLSDLRLVIGPALYYGELVLLRNQRADALLVRDLARDAAKREAARRGIEASLETDTPA